MRTQLHNKKKNNKSVTSHSARAPPTHKRRIVFPLGTALWRVTKPGAIPAASNQQILQSLLQSRCGLRSSRGFPPAIVLRLQSQVTTPSPHRLIADNKSTTRSASDVKTRTNDNRHNVNNRAWQPGCTKRTMGRSPLCAGLSRPHLLHAVAPL